MICYLYGSSMKLRDKKTPNISKLQSQMSYVDKLRADINTYVNDEPSRQFLINKQKIYYQSLMVVLIITLLVIAYIFLANQIILGFLLDLGARNNDEVLSDTLKIKNEALTKSAGVIAQSIFKVEKELRNEEYSHDHKKSNNFKIIKHKLEHLVLVHKLNTLKSNLKYLTNKSKEYNALIKFEKHIIQLKNINLEDFWNKVDDEFYIVTLMKNIRLLLSKYQYRILLPLLLTLFGACGFLLYLTTNHLYNIKVIHSEITDNITRIHKLHQENMEHYQQKRQNKKIRQILFKKTPEYQDQKVIKYYKRIFNKAFKINQNKKQQRELVAKLNLVINKPN